MRGAPVRNIPLGAADVEIRRRDDGAVLPRRRSRSAEKHRFSGAVAAPRV